MNTFPTSQRPLRGASAVPGDFSADEADSGVFQLSEQTVLLLFEATGEGGEVARALEASGFSVLQMGDARAAEGSGFLPRLAVLDASLPGALELVAKGASEKHGAPLQAVVVLDERTSETAAIAAGAQVTLHRPLNPLDVLTCLSRLRAQQDLWARSRDLFERERPSVPAPLIENVLATIGHEIRNPLAAALANVECLRDGGNAAFSEEDRLSTIDDTVLALRRIQDVMSAVSSLVKGTPPVLEKVSLWGVAERALGSVRAHDVRCEIAGDRELRGWGNVALLEQVTVNLLQNAVEAALGGEKPHVLVRVYAASGEARISVRDNGPGVLTPLRHRIFEPFFTTKGERHTGLGLVLARHAASRMGGTLSLGPSERGAVFRVRVRAV